MKRTVNVRYNKALPNTMDYVFEVWKKSTQATSFDAIRGDWEKDSIRLIISQEEWAKALEHENWVNKLNWVKKDNPS